MQVIFLPILLKFLCLESLHVEGLFCEYWDIGWLYNYPAIYLNNTLR